MMVQRGAGSFSTKTLREILLIGDYSINPIDKGVNRVYTKYKLNKWFNTNTGELIMFLYTVWTTQDELSNKYTSIFEYEYTDLEGTDVYTILTETDIRYLLDTDNTVIRYKVVSKC